MSILIFALLVIIVVAMAVWAESLLPLPQTPLVIIQAVTIMIGAIVIMQRAGMV